MIIIVIIIIVMIIMNHYKSAINHYESIWITNNHLYITINNHLYYESITLTIIIIIVVLLLIILIRIHKTKATCHVDRPFAGWPGGQRCPRAKARGLGLQSTCGVAGAGAGWMGLVGLDGLMGKSPCLIGKSTIMYMFDDV